MKKTLIIGVLISLCVVALICACNLAAQTESNKTPKQTEKLISISEIKSKKLANDSSPNDCLQSFREFFSYVQQSAPDISGDPQAQVRLLSYEMRKAVLKKTAFEDRQAKENPTDKRDYPDNGSFVGAWDYPTTYEIVGSRVYEERATVDVRYKWGDKTQYPGEERLSSFIFKKEDNLWKLEDVYTFDGRFNEAESLLNYFRKGY